MANKPETAEKNTSKTVSKKVYVKPNPIKQMLRVIYWLLLFGVALVIGFLLFEAYLTYYRYTQ